MIRFTILGNCYSMKNSKTLTARGGRMRSIKHDKAVRFERDFLLQVPPEAKRNIAHDVSVTLNVWYPSGRQDLEVALVHDLLQKAGVIQNDRQIIEQHNYRHIDAVNPRVVVEVSEVTK